LFCFILRLAPSQHRWTDFDDLYIIRRVSGGHVNTTPNSGAWQRPPILFVGGPNMCSKTNPRWRPSAILENWKRPYLHKRL